MSRVVTGRAMISPVTPKRLPHTDRDSNMIAGLRPVTFFMIFGIRRLSCMSCTMMNTRAVRPIEVHMFCPVSMLWSTLSKNAGMNPRICM